MIKVMVVEDEPPILRSIKNSIESADPAFKVVACAYDGEEALSLINSIKPDVVFTDIRMPVMDGISLIKSISKSYPEIITVILSGFQEFEYARSALQSGAFDYLLKPVSPKMLSDIVENIRKKVVSMRNEVSRDYLFSILNNDISLKCCSANLFEHSNYLLLLFCAGPFITFSIDYMSPARSYWNSFSLEALVSQKINTGEQAWTFDGRTAAEKILVLALNSLDVERADKLIEDIISLLPASRFPITMVASQFLTSIEDIGLSAQFVRSSLNKSIVIGSPQIIKQYISPSALHVNAGSQVIDSYIESKLILYINQNNVRMFSSELKKLLNTWEELRYPQIWVEKLLKHIITLAQRSITIPEVYDTWNLELEINEAISNAYSYNDLFNNFRYIFEEIFSAKRESFAVKDDMTVLMKKIDEYIVSNLAEPINTHTLSEKFGLVPPYLSKLFKNYKGMSPSEYLTHLRIGKAKELLSLQPDMLAKDISAVIGYSDPLYFSRIFKKETGLWPSEYKYIKKY